jgi:hypothetical protein
MSFWLWCKSPSRGSYEREMNARAAEKRGDHEQANLYRMCLCASEWHALGYEGSFGNYRKVKSPEMTLYEATNGAYGREEHEEKLRQKAKDAEKTFWSSVKRAAE